MDSVAGGLCIGAWVFPVFYFFFSSRRRHTRWNCDWSSDVCSSDLEGVGAESAARSSRAAARLDTGVTVLIVGRALVRVGEHLAGFLRLLEGLLRVPIVGVAVGVIFHREPAVGLLDLGLSRRPRYVEYLVVIALRHRRRLRGLASLVLHLFELGVHHVLAGSARATVLRAGRLRPGAVRRGCGLRGLGPLRDGA